MVDPIEKFIVAEISKNWPEVPNSPTVDWTLAQLFEVLINRNWERGYRLLSWKLDRVLAEEVNETIIAVFERREDKES